MSDPENVIPIKLANGEGDWRSVLADMLVALNRYGHEIGDGDIPSAHRNLIWRAEQLLAAPSPSPVSAPSPAGGVREALVYAVDCLVSLRKNYEEPKYGLWEDVSKAIKQGNAALSSPATPEPVSAPANGEVDEIMTRVYRRFKDWSARKFSADDVTWCEVRADILAIIAALSNPAPGHGEGGL